MGKIMKLCLNNTNNMYKPEYSINEFWVEDTSLDPSSKPRRFDTRPGGKDPGPDGDGICLPDSAIPGDGARRGGVARPNPESVSIREANIIESQMNW